VTGDEVVEEKELLCINQLAGQAPGEKSISAFYNAYWPLHAVPEQQQQLVATVKPTIKSL
jgi:hypothetical protein